MTLYPSYLMVSSRRYRQELPRFRFRWDDEISSYNFMSRTQGPDWTGDNKPPNPPAVLNYFPTPNDTGDHRVNLAKDPTWGWKETFLALNGNDLQKFEYWTKPGTAQFNSTGWAQFAYLGMCGNEINVLDWSGGWVKFQTLRPTDWLRARSLTLGTLIHQFTCVSWKDGQTVRIESTGTPRGKIFYPMVTWTGYAYIPERFVIRVS